MLKDKKTLIALSIIPQYLIIKWLSQYPEFIETNYSNGIYPIISKVLRYTLGWLPFSFGDLIYTLAIIYIFRWLIKNRKRIIKDTKNWFVDVGAAIAIIYFAFHLFWAMNYYRLPLHEKLNLDAEYTTEELVSVTKSLISKSNFYHNKLAKNDSAPIKIPYSKKKILKLVPNGYEALQKEFPYLQYKPKSIKKSLYSLPLTYMGFSGYLNPLSGEAQVDGLIPKFKFPTTASHEVAHQLGYAAENEANFIGALATINHDDNYFNYCGYTFALRYCLIEVFKRDETKFEELISTINKGILNNYDEVREFWLEYQNPLEPLLKVTYNGFLKANNQNKGIQSYSYVVALYVNFFEKAIL